MAISYVKEQALSEFRDIVDADLKLNPEEYFLDLPDGWPRRGGPRYVYYYKKNGDGSERLHHTPNLPHTNDNYLRGNRMHNKWEDKGFKRVWGNELIAIVEAQQKRTIARFADGEPEARALIPDSVDSDSEDKPRKRGRPRVNTD